MGNEQLKHAIQDAGLEPEGLADLIQVDTKTVQRWLAGRAPYPRHRQRVAKALGRQVHELWPELAEPQAPASPTPMLGTDGAAESLVAFAQADNEAAPDWFEFIGQATSSIDLLDLTLTDLSERGDLPGLLSERAASGCEIRILISHPDSAHLIVAEAENNPEMQLTDRPQLASEIEDTLDLLAQLAEQNGVEIRTFIAPGHHSVIRADDQMLVITHTWGTTTSTAPLLHLDINTSPQMFLRFLAHYDATWQAANPTHRS